MILPSDFNFKGEPKSKKFPNQLVIKGGKLIQGVIDSKNIGQESGLLLRSLHKKYGPEKTITILENMFRLGIEVLSRYGFSTGISDTDLPEDAKQKITEAFDNARREVNELIRLYHENQLEAFPGRSILETLELRILELLNKTRNNTGKIVADYADQKTTTIIMADSGARGNPLNLAQMAACVGQQALRGKRISTGYADRTLSNFKKNDLSPEARGFVAHGFKNGLTPYEFFFGSMTGRDSLMDTALRTPKSGYLYRRLANAMQDLKVEYDETVRNAAGKIIQFKYGEDGIDVSKSENGKINIKRIMHEV
jgi:DNA-directed RNA polymerase subunit A'